MKYNPEDILPHNHPMILIDELLEADIEKNTVKTKVTITENKIFFDKNLNGVDYTVGLEYMAQTIGCFAYFRNGCKKPEVGFLLGSRQFKNEIEYFKKDETYIIEAKELFSDNELVSFECFIYNNDKICQRAVVNVYQPNDNSIKSLAEMYE